MVLQLNLQKAVSIYARLFQNFAPSFEAGVLEAVYTKIVEGDQ